MAGKIKEGITAEKAKSRSRRRKTQKTKEVRVEANRRSEGGRRERSGIHSKQIWRLTQPPLLSWSKLSSFYAWLMFARQGVESVMFLLPFCFILTLSDTKENKEKEKTNTISKHSPVFHDTMVLKKTDY